MRSARVLPFHQLHHEELLPVRFFEPVERSDMGMIQRGKQSRLPFESRDPVFILGKLLWKNFDGNFAAKLRISGSVDLTHSAFANELEDFVVREHLAR